MKFNFETDEGLAEALNMVRSAFVPGQRWALEFKRYRKKRTHEQLRYFWGVVVRMICDEYGNDKDDIHDLLCGEYFGWETYKVFGNLRRRPIQTLSGPEKIPTEDMSRFIDWCIAWAAQHDIMIPLPREVITDGQ